MSGSAAALCSAILQDSPRFSKISQLLHCCNLIPIYHHSCFQLEYAVMSPSATRKALSTISHPSVIAIHKGELHRYNVEAGRGGGNFARVVLTSTKRQAALPLIMHCHRRRRPQKNAQQKKCKMLSAAIKYFEIIELLSRVFSALCAQ